MSTVRLVAVAPDGVPVGVAGELPGVAREALQATQALYARIGYHEPWINYLAIADSIPVGLCGFTSPPVDGRVEIAYFTFPEHETRGHAGRMAAALIDIARRHDPAVEITARTLPERAASHRVLERLGFGTVALLLHPEDGPVLEWVLGDEGQTAASLHGEPCGFVAHAAAAAARLPAAGGLPFAALFRHGTLSIEIFRPQGTDTQQPHDRDEAYVVAAGTAEFVHGPRRDRVGPGDFLFVPAGLPHRFEAFSDGFTVWVLFYGPVGGEPASGSG